MRHERVKFQDAVVLIGDGEGCVFEYQHRIGTNNTRNFEPWSGTYGFDTCEEVRRGPYDDIYRDRALTTSSRCASQ